MMRAILASFAADLAPWVAGAKLVLLLFGIAYLTGATVGAFCLGFRWMAGG